MQDSQKGRQGRAPLSVRQICFCALLAAMSLILGKFLQIPNPLQDFIRISFENLPILLAGLSMGPLAGGLVGVVADLVGCVLYGYSVNPLVTLGALSVGVISGLCAYLPAKTPTALRVLLATVAAHLCGSVLIKSFGLAAWYLGTYEIGLFEFILWRLFNYVLVGAAEGVLLFLLFGNKTFRTQIERMKRT